MSGGGKTQTSTSQLQIPPEVLARYNSVNASAEKAASTPFQTYSNDPNKFVAQTTNLQNQGFGNVSQAGNAVNLGGLNTNQYLSPFLGDVYNSTVATENQQNAQQASQLQGNAITSGAFGGDRSGIAAANLAYQQGLANNQTNANILNQGYTQAQNVAGQQQAAQLATDQANRQALLQSGQAQIAGGTLQQQTNQAGLSALYNQFQQQQAYPFQTAQFLANIAEGTGALSGNTTTTTSPAPFFSDRRLKENIKQIGKADNGLPIYTYNYKDDPHEQTHIGFMADEVEKKHPDAVGLSGGYKTVDYDKASRPKRYAGGLIPEYAGGGDVDLAQIINEQRQALGLGSASGAMGQGIPGKASYVPGVQSAGAPHMATSQAQISKPQTGMQQAQSALDTGKTIGGLYDAGKTGLFGNAATANSSGSEGLLSSNGQAGLSGGFLSDIGKYLSNPSGMKRGGLVPPGYDDGGVIPYNNDNGLGQIVDMGNKPAPQMATSNSKTSATEPTGNQILDAAKTAQGLGTAANTAAGLGSALMGGSALASGAGAAAGAGMAGGAAAGAEGLSALLPLLLLKDGGAVHREHHADGDAVGNPDDPADELTGLAALRRPADASQARDAEAIQSILRPSQLSQMKDAVGIQQALRAESDPNAPHLARPATGLLPPVPTASDPAVDTLPPEDTTPTRALAYDAPRGPAVADRAIAAPQTPTGGLVPDVRPAVDNIANAYQTPNAGPAYNGQQPTTNQGGLTGLLTNEKFWVPLLSGLGAMASSPSRYLGSAMLQGLGAGAQSYQGLEQQQAQRGFEGQRVNNETQLRSLEALKYMTDNMYQYVDPTTNQSVWKNRLTGQTMSDADHAAQINSIVRATPSLNPGVTGGLVPPANAAAPSPSAVVPPPTPVSSGPLPELPPTAARSASPVQPATTATAPANDVSQVDESKIAQANQRPSWLTAQANQQTQAALEAQKTGLHDEAKAHAERAKDYLKQAEDIQNGSILPLDKNGNQIQDYKTLANQRGQEAELSGAIGKKRGEFYNGATDFFQSYPQVRQILKAQAELAKFAETNNRTPELAEAIGFLRSLPGIRDYVPENWKALQGVSDETRKLAVQQALTSISNDAASKAPKAVLGEALHTVADTPLGPEAKFSIITQKLAEIDKQNDLYGQWLKNKPEPAGFQNEFNGKKENQTSEYIKRAQAEVGPFKGQTSIPGAPNGTQPNPTQSVAPTRPPIPAGIPTEGLKYSPSRRQYRAADGTIYDETGKKVSP